MLDIMVPPKLANVIRVPQLPRDYVPAQELERGELEQAATGEPRERQRRPPLRHHRCRRRLVPPAPASPASRATKLAGRWIAIVRQSLAAASDLCGWR